MIRKGPTSKPAAPDQRDDHFYEELTRTNNELANLQREMARKNTELAAAQKELQILNAELESRVAERTKALSVATLEAERASLAKSDFLSRVSHELRTPLNAILGFAQVLEGEDDLSGEQQDSVRQIVRGGSHLLRLINEVLDISSIESGKMTLSSEPVALLGLVEECVGLLGPLSVDSKIQLAVQRSDALGRYVRADRQRLKQVLMNLLGNAIKYNRPGGSVAITALASGGAASTIQISVTDTGWGISPEKLARLFSPFDRLGAEHTRVEGTGLGLALAKAMVEHMGGTLGVHSVVGTGSTFWVELPQAEPPAEPEELPSSLGDAAEPVALSERRVLLYIEDNPSNLRLVARIIARRPAIELLCAETGAVGLTLAREHHPDLILLDLHLPDHLGDEVLAQLAADPRTGKIPVVILSADAVPGKRDQLLAAGARAFITKPLDVRAFLGVVDRFLTAAP